MNKDKNLSVVIFYGALWGVAESTVGYLLHWIPQLLPVSNLSGLIMFPVGLFFMTAAATATGKPSAALATAGVTAGIKLASVALPFVAFRFVRNPVLAILAEGTIVFVLLSVTELRPNRSLLPKVFAASVLWRGLFLLANLALGLKGGILAKPTETLLSFLFFDSAVNAVIIAGAVFISDRGLARENALRRLMPTLPIGVAALVAALGIEAGLALI